MLSAVVKANHSEYIEMECGKDNAASSGSQGVCGVSSCLLDGFAPVLDLHWLFSKTPFDKIVMHGPFFTLLPNRRLQ